VDADDDGDGDKTNQLKVRITVQEFENGEQTPLGYKG